MQVSGSEIYDRVKKITKSRGLTMKKLCDSLNISENGMKYGLVNKTIKLDTLLRISTELNVDYKKIIEGEEYKTNMLNEEQAEYKNSKMEQLKLDLEECRKDKERAWGMVSWLQEQVDELKKKEAS